MDLKDFAGKLFGVEKEKKHLKATSPSFFVTDEGF